MKSGLNATESHDLSLAISKFVFPQQATTVRQLIDDPDETRRLSMGSKPVDDLFVGGLPLRGIIEVTGEAGAGKSQFCLQACLQTIVRVYILNKYLVLTANNAAVCRTRRSRRTCSVHFYGGT